VDRLERCDDACFAVLFEVAVPALLRVERETGLAECRVCFEVRAMLACADLRTGLIRAAPADDARNRIKQPAMKTDRNIRGARRNQSIFSVRLARKNLECRAWFRFV
jgi:hypothetical protein